MKRSVANTAAASVEATTAPSRDASSHEKSNRARAATAVSSALTTTPTVLSSAAGTATWRSRRHDVCRPALVEDQGKPDDPHLTRELRVIELDPARPVRAQHHPKRKKRHQHRQPCTRRTKRKQHARGEHSPDHQQHQPFIHAPILALRETRRRDRAALEPPGLVRRRMRARVEPGSARAFTTESPESQPPVRLIQDVPKVPRAQVRLSPGAWPRPRRCRRTAGSSSVGSLPAT